MIPILILAAGASSRMRGIDKLMLEVNGVPLLRRQALMALQVSADVRLALPAHAHARHDVVRDLAVQRVEVAHAAEGMNASLRAIFATLEPHVTHAMLLLADLADLTSGDLRAVIAARVTHPQARIWRGATSDGIGGHPILFERSLFAAFQDLSGDAGGQAVIRQAGDAVHLVALTGQRARADLDTPEDWAAWRAARPKGVTP